MTIAIPQAMTQRRRELIFKVLAEEIANTKLLYFVYVLDRLTRCDDILGWLINNRITGRNFKAFIEEYKLTPLSLSRLIIRLMAKEEQERPIVYGKDFIG